MIILCVTGSIAATESIKLARELKRNDVEVKCFMSEAACDIITPNAMEFATGNEVVTRLTGKIEHVKYSQEDLILVAPATANTISKLAYKLADQCLRLLKTILIKLKKRVLLHLSNLKWMKAKQNSQIKKI